MWLLCTFKERRNYIKGNIFLKQLLMATFAGKRYGKAILVHIIEEEVYKVLTNKEFADETNNPMKKWKPHKKLNTH